MKYIIVFFITIYQLFISPVIKQLFGEACRYQETCSSYAKRVISQEGVIKGIPKAVVRLLSCHPFAKIQQ